MYLSKIVLDGFKSFYTRTEINLDGGMTNIVGPNGCGKSNILDAVRWVLGEQSAKQLRGELISDVISNGNARRAAKQRAVAYLTFSDCGSRFEKDEIEVGREVDRTGQGTYYLNGEEVRLKDIKNLFRDTGIGKDLYSVIGQGEIQKLIQSKPEGRREIVEEAAGVATFHHRRRLTRRRLKQTRKDLEQITTDLREDQGRLSRLEGQAKKARRVRKIQGQLRHQRLEYTLRRLKNLRGELSEVSELEQQAAENLKNFTNRRDRIKERRQKIKHRLNELEDDLRLLEQKTEFCQSRLASERGESTRLETLSKELYDQNRSDRKRRRGYLKRLQDNIEKLIDSHQKMYQSRLSETINSSKSDVLTEREQQLRENKRAVARDLEDLRSDSLFQVSEESEHQHLVKALSEEKEELLIKKRQAEETAAQISEQSRNHRKKLRTAYQNYVDSEVNRIELKIKGQIFAEQQQAVNELNNRVSSKLDELERKKEISLSRDRTLSRLQSNYEGYYDGVKEVMQYVDSNNLEGVIGVLANLIEVEPDYRQAIQAALGSYRQAIVVDDFSVARRLLEVALKEEAGRLTILPRKLPLTVENPLLSQQVLNAPDVLKPARDVVEADRRFNSLLSFLLGDTVVVKDYQAGLKLMGQNGTAEGIKLVSLEGVILEPRGTIKGGSFEGNGTDILGRTEELRRLRERRSELTEQIKNLQKIERRFSRWAEQVDERKERVAGALRGVREESRENYEKIGGVRHQLLNERRQYGGVLQKIAELEEKRLQNNYARLSAKKIASTIADRDRRRRRQRDSLRQQLEKEEKLLERVQTGWRSLEKNLQNVRAERRRAEDRVEQFEARRHELIEEIVQIDLGQRERGNRWLEAEEKRSFSRLRLNRLVTERQTWEKLRSALQSLRSGRQQRLEDVNESLRHKERELERGKNELNRLSNRRANLEERRARQEEILSDEFEIDPEANLSSHDTGDAADLTDEQLQKNIRKLKDKLRSLQPVNMLADKEVEKLREQVADVRAQKEDLEQTCEKLEKVIDSLNRKARVQFREAFAEIKDYFADFVEELFGGGRGKMELTADPILEAGVKIEVQPPGEKIKTMSALSGGEKSLASIAFLFALFEYSPTPFCFLDEVDAPLDPDNVSQMINLLHRYSTETQFVIITHNKITMQAASQLFGITMEESGVSTVVGLDLPEAEEWREEAVS